MGTFRHSLEKQVFLPPYLIKDPSIFVFMLEGDAKTIQDKIVDPVLSEPGKSDFELLFDGKFLIQFIRQQHLSSLSTLERDAGFFRYHETIVYLVVKHRESGEKFWFAPSMFLDSFLPVVAGREIYGIPKGMGVISMPEIPTPQPVRFELEAEVFPTSGLSTPLQAQQIYEFDTRSGVIGGEDPHYGELIEPDPGELDMAAFAEKARAHYLAVTPGAETKDDSFLGDLWDMFRFFVSMTRPGIFLKQLPAGDGSTDAAYQELMTAKFTPKKFRGFRFFNGYYGTFFNHNNYPLADALGVTDSTAIRADLGFWISADFEAEPASPVSFP